jgi:surface carbohydrate biosynthesis protein
MKKRHLYIAIGTKHRELDAKVLLACYAANAGFTVILGSVSAIQKQLHKLPAGIYIKQLVTEGTADTLRRFRSYGHTVCAFDEEGLVFPDPEAYKRERISANAMKYVSKFFAWGEYQAKLVREVIGPENANKVVVTGHPRLDILRPEWRDFYKAQADIYQKQHGSYILINTNFDLFNHADGREAFFERLRKAGRINSPDAEKWFRGWAAFRGRMYRCFRELIRELAAQLPDKTFIIRPHPSENHDEWKKFAYDFNNVKVIYEGAAIPWILGSDCLVHNGCTTAVEAYVLNKPVISYQPFVDDRYDNYLPNNVGFSIRYIDSFVSLIRNNYKDKIPNQEIESSVFMESLNGIASCYRIINELPEQNINSMGVFRFLYRLMIKKRIISIIKVFKGANLVNKTKSIDSIQRNPGINFDEVRNIVSRLSIFNISFQKISTTKHSEGVTIIESNN